MNEEYTKNFKAWSKKKEFIEKRVLPDDFYFLEGEIWWAVLGVNIGHEIDGKNDMYERPVLVLKKISESTCCGSCRSQPRYTLGWSIRISWNIETVRK